MSFISSIRKKLEAKKINKIIKHYKFVHIMFNDKFNKPFVDFLNRNFDSKEHLVLVKKFFDEFPFPQGNNVIKIKSLYKLNFENVEKIFCHSLFDRELLEYLFKHQDILKNKSYWLIWGGDLYNAPRDEKNDFVRENFKGYVTDVDGDKAFLEKTYNQVKNKKFYPAAYTFPVSLEMINDAKNTISKKHKTTIIQINNSCDETTLEILDILSALKNEDIMIKTILSYGELKFKEEIIKKGSQIFGEKFTYIDTILSPNDYARYVCENDVLIYNQNRQQGLGNSFLALQFGQKLFIRSSISTFDYLFSKGCKIFDTKSIPQMDFKSFVFIDEQTRNNNIKNSQKFFTDEYIKNLWEKVFNNTIEYWQNRAKNFGKHSVYNMTHSLDELDAVDKKQEKIYLDVLKKYLHKDCLTALDFGCGAGRFEPMLSKVVDKVYAADPISTLLELAPKLENVEYILLQDTEKLPLLDDSMDLIFVSLALGGIVDEAELQRAVAELQRVSKPNALFFIVENTANEENSSYWHYRKVEEYIKLFKPVNLVLETSYEDVGEEISVMVGRKGM